MAVTGAAPAPKTIVLLADGTTSQTLLKQLIAAEATIERFEMIEPSLNDIFIEKVTEKV